MDSDRLSDDKTFKGDRKGDGAATDGHKDGERGEKESEMERDRERTDRLTRADRRQQIHDVSLSKHSRRSYSRECTSQ